MYIKLFAILKILSIVVPLLIAVAYFTTAKRKEFEDRFLDSLILSFYGPALFSNWLFNISIFYFIIFNW